MLVTAVSLLSAVAVTAGATVVAFPGITLPPSLEDLFSDDKPEPLPDPEIETKEQVDLEVEGEITEELAERFVRHIGQAKAAKRIDIHINTPGGDVDAALLLVRAMEKAAARAEVVCLVDGEAVSAGFYILQSCPVRRMTRRSKLMAHEPYLVATATYVKRAEATKWLERIDAESYAYAEQCSARMKISAEQFLAKIRGRDWWIKPAEALKVGAVDEVIASPSAAKISPPPKVEPKK